MTNRTTSTIHSTGCNVPGSICLRVTALPPTAVSTMTSGVSCACVLPPDDVAHLRRWEAYGEKHHAIAAGAVLHGPRCCAISARFAAPTDDDGNQRFITRASASAWRFPSTHQRAGRVFLLSRHEPKLNTKGIGIGVCNVSGRFRPVEEKLLVSLRHALTR